MTTLSCSINGRHPDSSVSASRCYLRGGKQFYKLTRRPALSTTGMDGLSTANRMYRSSSLTTNTLQDRHPVDERANSPRDWRHNPPAAVSMIDIPIQYRKSPVELTATSPLPGAHKYVHSSLPSLWPTKSPRGLWPPNVTSITTRSIVRQDSRLGSISETNVYGKTFEEERLHTSRTEERRHSRQYHSKKHYNQYRHSEDRTCTHNECRCGRRHTPEYCRYRPSRRLSEDNALSRETHTRELNQLAAMSEVSTLNKNLEEFEERLLRCNRLPAEGEDLSELVDDLTHLQYKIRFDTSLVDRLLYNVERLQFRSRSPLFEHAHVDNEKIIHSISKAVRRWESVASEVDNRQKIAESALRTLRKCELLLSSEESWLRGLKKEEDVLRSCLDDTRASREATLKSISELLSELASHSHRVTRVNELTDKFFDTAEEYGEKVGQYREQLRRDKLQKSDTGERMADLSASRTSACTLRRRVERLNREYTDLLNSSEKLKQQLTRPTPAIGERTAPSAPRSVTVLTGDEQEVHASGAGMARLLPSMPQPISRAPEWSESLDDRRDYKTGFTGIWKMAPSMCAALDKETLKWLGRRKAVYDPARSTLSSFVELVDAGRLATTSSWDMPPFSPLNRCYIMESPEEAISGISCCIYEPLKPILCRHGGFFPDGTRDISLLEAIATNFLDLQCGGVRSTDGRLLSIEQAFDGHYIDEKGMRNLVELVEALRNLPMQDETDLFNSWQSFISKASNGTVDLSTICDTPLSFQDCFDLGLIHPDSGRLIHPVSGQPVSIVSSVQQGIISPNIHEIVFSGSVSKLTLQEAMARKVVDTGVDARLHDLGRQFNLHEAITHHLIEKPMTLSDAFVQNLVDEDGRVLNRRTCQRLSFKDAIDARALDSCSKHIVHPVTKAPLSLDEAIRLKLIDYNGRFSHPNENEHMSLWEAVKTNKLQLISLKPTIKGAVVRDTAANRMVSVAESIYRGIVDLQADTFTDTKAGTRMTINEATNRGLILPLFHSYMSKLVASQESQLDGRSIKQCILSGTVKLLDNAICLRFVRTERCDQRVDFTSQADDTFTLTIANAVKYGIISAADGALLREMRGAITREAYITVYVDNISADSSRLPASVDSAAAVGDHRSKARFVLRPPVASIDGFDASDIVSSQHQHDLARNNTSATETASLRKPLDNMTSTYYSRSTLPMNFIDAVYRQLLNIDTGRFSHPQTHQPLSIRSALEQALINPYTAFVVDQTTDKSYNLREAVNEGLITEENRVLDKKSKTTISMAEAMRNGTMTLGDPSLSYYGITSKTESFSIQSVKDTLTGQYIDPNKAIKLDILDLYNGTYLDRNGNKRYAIDQAIALGFIIVEGLSDSRRSGPNFVSGTDKIISTNLIRETRSYNLVGVVDALTGKDLTVQEALDLGILHRSKGQYMDRRRNKWISISEAIYEGLVKVTLEPVSPNRDEIRSKRAVSETKTYALRGARNTKSNEIITIGKAIEDGIIDQRTGLFYDVARNEAMPISVAVERNLIITEEDESGARRHMFYGPAYLTREHRFLSVEYVVNPASGERLSIEDAITDGLLNTTTCTFLNPVTGETLSLTDAYSKGYLIGKYVSESEVANGGSKLIAKVHREERSYLVTSVLDTRSQTKVSFRDAVDRGIFNMDRGVYINPLTSEESSLCEAMKHGYVDAKRMDDAALTHRQSTTTKVVRAEKSPALSKSYDKQPHDAYIVDAVEEYVESVQSQDKFEQSAHSQATRERADAHEGGPFPNMTSVSHSTYHTVHHKERNVKERDILIKSDLTEAAAGATPDGVSHIEEIVIDGKRGERVIDVSSTPSSKLLPIVIEDTRPTSASQIIVVDEGLDFTGDSARRQVRDEQYKRKLRVDSREREPTPAVETTMTEGVVTRARDIIRTGSQYGDDEDRTLERSSRETVPPCIKTETRRVTSEGSEDIWSRQTFVDEILNKAKDYRSSVRESERSSITEEWTYMSKGLVHTLSWVLEPETKKRLPLNEGIERGIFSTKDMTYHDTLEGKYYGTEEAVRLGLIGTDEDCSPIVINADGITYTIRWVLDPSVKQRILPRKAVQKGVLHVKQKRYFNPQNNVSISIHEAVKMKFIGADEQRPDSDEITVTVGSKTVTFSWVLDAVARKRLSAYDALKRGLVDISSGVYFKQDTGDVLTLWDALLAGFIGVGVDITADANLRRSSSLASLDDDELTISTKTATYVITGVIHPVTQQELKVSEAIDLGVLDKDTGAYRDLSTGAEYELSDAINDGLMYATIIESKETTEMETSSIKHVFQRYIINKVIDPRTGKPIGGLQAQAAGILNYAQGLYTDPDTQRGIPIREAIDKTLIEVELVNQTSDEQFELDLIKDSLLERRITIFSIYNVVDPVIEENISAQEAVNRGILDSDTRTYFNAANGQYYELHDALARGLIQADVKEHVMRKPLGLSLQNAARLGFYSYETGKFKDPCSEEVISLNDALEKGHIHINGPAIACVKDVPISLRDAFNLRLISRANGRLDRDRLVRGNGRVSENRIYRMNVEDAVRCGLLDLHTGLYRHIHSGERLALKDAITRGLLDGESVVMEHPITGAFMSLTQVLSTIIVDRQGVLTDAQGQRIPSTLDKEFNQRRLFSAFNVNTGELFIPRLGEMVSFEKYVQRCLSEVKLHLYHFKTDREYTITEAIEHGIIDPDTGKVFDNLHQETMSIREAIRRGYIAVKGAPVVPFKADHDALAVRVTSRKRRLSSRTRSGGIQSVASGDASEDAIHHSYECRTNPAELGHNIERLTLDDANDEMARSAGDSAKGESRIVQIQDMSDRHLRHDRSREAGGSLP